MALTNLASKKKDLKFDNRVLYDVPSNTTIDEDIDEREFSYHDKIRICGIQYCTSEYCQKLGYDDSYVYISGEFFRIENILTDKNNITYIIGFRLISHKVFDNMFTYSEGDHFVLKKTNNNFRQCVSIQIMHSGEIIKFISMCKFSTQID